MKRIKFNLFIINGLSHNLKQAVKSKWFFINPSLWKIYGTVENLRKVYNPNGAISSMLGVDIRGVYHGEKIKTS